MALPPERITVKRRRDDDPVEGLYIHPRKYRPSAYWKRLPADHDSPRDASATVSNGPVKSSQLPLASNDVPIAPGISLEDGIGRQACSSSHHPKKPEASSHQILSVKSPLKSSSALHHREHSRDIDLKQDSQASPLEHRRFHLSKSPLARFSPYSLPNHGIHQQRKSRKGDIAMFEEKLPRKVHNEKTAKSHASVGGDNPSEKITSTTLSEPRSTRKRPNATAAERAWRNENWGKAKAKATGNGNDTLQKTAQTVKALNQWDYSAKDLAEQLYAIALEETEAQNQQDRILPARREPKLKPKHPKPRHPSNHGPEIDNEMDTAFDDSETLGNDKEYVFDTYVRMETPQNEAPGLAEVYVDPFQGIDGGKVGVLVIEDEEEALWETFGEDHSSDEGWITDEEDENAEDYYGNDYPEDEVASDDEYDRCAYDYRHQASDNEEFDDTVDWSEGEET